MKVGTIKKIFYDKRYGFIVPDGGGLDVFFHVSVYTGDIPFYELKRGYKVKYLDEVVNAKVRAVFVQYSTDLNKDASNDSDKRG